MTQPVSPALCLRWLCPELQIFDYETDFDELWDPDRSFTGTVVLVWGDTPAGDAAPVATAPYVSPIHWAVHAASAALSQGATFSASIVDLRPRVHHDQIPLYALLKETTSKGWPGWIRLVYLADLLVSSPADLLGALQPAAQLKAGPSPSLDLLVDQVRTHLSDPAERDSRHSLANLLGPMVLLGDIPVPVPPPPPAPAAPQRSASHRLALWQLLRLTRLLPELPSRPDVDPHGLESGTRIFLLDDQWHHGWGQWLCTMLNVSFEAPSVLADGPQRISKDGSEIEVFAAGHPDWLLEKLHRPPTPFQLRLDSEGRPGQEILLLDLRLFAQNEAAERPFVDRVRAACRPYENQQPGFTSDELVAEPSSPTSRGLLGRLLALKDLSLPVILFSSTSDRSYVKEFENCPNVTTSFAKPGRPGQRFEAAQRAATAQGFFEALREAKKLCDARAFIQRLLERPKNALPTRSSSSTHVEIFVDESGEGKFSVGGIALLYPNGLTPDQLNADLLAEGIIWGLAEGHPPAHANDHVPTEHFPKNPRTAHGTWSAYCPYLDRIAQFFEDRQVECVGFGLTWAPNATDDWSRVPELLREDVLDNRYRRMTEEVLEALLYAVLPARAASSAEISVFCGTRVQPMQRPYDQAAIAHRFGISSFHGEAGRSFYYVLGPNSVYEIVARVMANREGVPPNVQRAVGVRLYDYDDVARWNPERRQKRISKTSLPRARQIHYLADWFARFGWAYPSVPPHALIASSFKRGFLDYRNDGWHDWLRASRAAAENRVTDSLFLAWQAERGSAASGPWPIARWLRQEVIPDCATRLGGSDFVELAARIYSASRTKDRSHVSPRETTLSVDRGDEEFFELLARALRDRELLRSSGTSAPTSDEETSRGSPGMCWRIDGLPIPGMSGFRRSQLDAEVRGLGFSSEPRRVVNQFFLDVMSAEDQEALEAVLRASGTRLCGYEVRFVAAEEHG